MYPNCDKYQELAIFLDQLQTDVTTNKLDVKELQQNLAQLQQFFVQEIAPLPDISSREQSYRTEISKQLRLLAVDVMFLQGARQLTTAEMRLKTIGDRLMTLSQYCQAILQPDQ
jgi:hypothetical protein